jgi:protein-S-isoprenylcysteine O-methyltransferase Ste14
MSLFIFRHRFWFFALIFWTGFALAAVDHVNMAAAIARLAVPSLDLDTGAGRAVLRVVFGAGAVCMVAAAAVRTWATAYLQTVVVHDSAIHSEVLVAAGPYRYTRNPLYFGASLLSVGFGIMASRLGFCFIVAGVTLLQLTLIGAEERRLRAEHPDTFAAYCARVPRFLPSLTPRLPPSMAVPKWGQAFLGEGFFWVFAAGAVGLAVTLRWQWAVALSVAGLLFHIVVVGLIRRRARHPPAS